MTYFASLESGKPSGLLITQADIDKLYQEELRPLCHEEGGKFLCRIRGANGVVSKNKHETIKACNAQFDKFMVLHGTIYKPRHPKKSSRGYMARKDRDGNVYAFSARITIDGKQVPIGEFKTKKEAREAYLDRFEVEFGNQPK